MQTNIQPKRAYGRVMIGYQTVMHLVAQGRHMVEKITSLPQLPENVFVHSVYNSYFNRSFSFLLESDEPVEGWTDYVEEGMEVPVSPVQSELYKTIVFRNVYEGKYTETEQEPE